MTTTAWIPSKKDNTRPVETQHTTNFLHPSCRQLHGKIHGERECTAPTSTPCDNSLQMLVRLGWQTIMWLHHQVGLQWTKGPPINAQLCQQSPCLVPTHSPQKRQDQPYPHFKPTYGAKSNIHKAGNKFIQEVCGVFLYLAHAVDGGLLPALSSLASQ
jgi:hypothetical protein